MQTAFYVGLLAKRQVCLHFALYKNLTPVFGGGEHVQLSVKVRACTR